MPDPTVTDTDGFFLDRPGQQELRGLLEQIPGLVEDLAVTVTRQDRVRSGGRGRSGRLDASPMPVNLHAVEMRDELHAVLAGWVRRTCEARQLTYDGTGDLLGVARWLRRWLIAVALTDGADDVVAQVAAAMRRCRRAVDLPPEDGVQLDDRQVQRARMLTFSRQGIRDMCRQIGGDARGVTKRRLETLIDGGHVVPVRVIRVGRDQTDIYRLGDVLDAHAAVPQRTRASG
ncbi:hypothetical protein [Tomitella gaofuii]|uniref:hypothetical protein n=1 Tax=Tomitella gaofuii TaxID=2760083 RepID=UPI0015FA91EC|nr:hypothetical protein [Tomitella gaofuii]